jgi:hypothetical protein
VVVEKGMPGQHVFDALAAGVMLPGETTRTLPAYCEVLDYKQERKEAVLQVGLV